MSAEALVGPTRSLAVGPTRSEFEAVCAPCNLRGVKTEDVAEFLDTYTELISVDPMCFVFADMTELRASSLRMMGLDEAALYDAFKSTQRNALFWELFRCLHLPLVGNFDLELPTDPETSDQIVAGEPEPLWYVVDVMVHRRLESKSSEEDLRPGRSGVVGEDAEELWHEFWAYYRKKASEPVATNAQLRAGVVSAPPRSAPAGDTSSSSATANAPRWMKAGAATARGPRAHQLVGPRTQGLTGLASPPGAAPSSSRPSTRGATPTVAERILTEMKNFEEQLATMPVLPRQVSVESLSSDDEASPSTSFRSRLPPSPRAWEQKGLRSRPKSPASPRADDPSPRQKAPQHARGSVICGMVPRAVVPSSAGGEVSAPLSAGLSSEMPLSEESGVSLLLETSIAGARRGAQLVALPKLRLPTSLGAKDRYCFKGFEDYKQRKELLCEVPRAKKKPLPYRAGLAMDRMPSKPGETSLPPSALRMAKAAEKDRLYAEEVLKDMAGRSQSEWTLAVHEYMQVRKTREKPDIEEAARPKPMTPAGRNSPATAQFRRPWSREGMAKGTKDQSTPDGYLAPISRYAKVCLSSGVHPQPNSVRFLVSLPPKLDIRAAGYSDEDLLALAASLPFASSVEAFDMGENSRLNDSSACTMLSVLAKRHPRHMRTLILDHCARLGKETIALCTKLLHGTFIELQHLNVSGVSIGMHEYGELATALEVHPKMRTVHLAKTGLGFFSKFVTAQVIRSIVGNRRITELELGWNSLGLSAFEVLGKGLAENQHISNLGLASTGPCYDPEAGGSPLLIFLELLHGDATLASLDISNNVLDGSAPVLLEYSLRRHPRLELINISRNPLGPDGMRSLIRLLAHPECTELTKIVANECAGGQPLGGTNSFFDVDPSGVYTLSMANPTQRAMLQLLLARLTERLPSASLGTFFRDVTLTTSGREAPFNFDTLKRSKGSGWQVPQAGDLRFELSAGSVLLSSEDDSESPAVVVERISRRARMSLTCERKVLAVLTFIKSTSDELARDVLLDALSRDFLLTPDQVKALCRTESKHLNCGHDPAGTCTALLASVFCAAHVRQAVSCTVTFGDLGRVSRAGRWLLSLNLENPTGHYDLALSEPMDRSTAERLLLLNRWQLHVWRASGLIDITQHENGKNLRNEVYSSRSFVWKAEEWHLPSGGASLSFDYVPLCRPPKGAEPISQGKWREIQRFLKHQMRHEAPSTKKILSPRRRRSIFLRCPPELKRTYNALSETPNVVTAEDVLWALRAASGRFWLTCFQLRELLNLFHDAQLRMQTVAYFFLRCIDWPVNGKLCRAKFKDDHWMELHKRLGYINLFPYFQPECLSVSLDLGDHEQRRVMHFLVRLQSSENVRNIKKARFDKNGSSNFEPFTAGIPMSWDQFDSIPCRGIVELTYMCSNEHVRLRARRRLAASVGGWSHLPEENNKLQNIVCWWSVLDDVPLEVVRVLVFLVSTFNTMADAFNACDANKDGIVNHKEWVKKLQAMNCCSGARLQRDSPGLLGDGPAMQGTKEDQEEVLTAVYRFLDTSNDGDISKKEFEIFNAIWRELSQSMWELKEKMLLTFGSLGQAWDNAEIENDSMRYSEFVRLADESHFDGPLRQIFLYLDQDNNDSIEENEWGRLAEAKRRAPD